MRRMVHAACLTLCIANTALAQARVHRNVVYGMFSGLALLMDVHVPDRPNGFGILLIPGSGFHTAQGYDGASIKDGGSAAFAFLPSILDAGYTVFVVNHRAAPTFRYPAAVQDVQRAVRFVRAKAAEYGIEGTRLGVVGYSSGGYLAVMLGVLDGNGNSTDAATAPEHTSRVQCVVASAAIADMTVHARTSGAAVSFMGQLPPSVAPGAPVDATAAQAYRDASPVAHVSRASAPLLLIHGDADTTVRFEQAELMVAAAEKAGVTVRLIRIPGGDHRFALNTATHPASPDVFGETVRWLDRCFGR